MCSGIKKEVAMPYGDGVASDTEACLIDGKWYVILFNIVSGGETDGPPPKIAR